MGGRGSSFKDINNISESDEYWTDYGDADQDELSSEKNNLTKELKNNNILTCKSLYNLDENVVKTNLKQIIDLSYKQKSIIDDILNDTPIKIRSYMMNRISKKTYKKSPEYSVLALFSPIKKQICFNARVLKDIPSIERIIESSQKTGHSVKTDKNKAIFHIVTHEFGHFVEDCIIQKKIQQNVFDWSKYRKLIQSKDYDKQYEANEIRKKYAEEIKLQIKQIATDKYNATGSQLKTSKYGESDDFEFFAEIYAESQLHTTRKPLIKAMQDFLKEGI